MNETTLQTSGLAADAGHAPAAPWRRWSRAFDLYNFSTNTSFTRAIWMIYLAGHGYSPLTIGLLEMLSLVLLLQKRRGTRQESSSLHEQ